MAHTPASTQELWQTRGSWATPTVQVPCGAGRVGGSPAPRNARALCNTTHVHGTRGPHTSFPPPPLPSPPPAMTSSEERTLRDERRVAGTSGGQHRARRPDCGEHRTWLHGRARGREGLRRGQGDPCQGAPRDHAGARNNSVSSRHTSEPSEDDDETDPSMNPLHVAVSARDASRAIANVRFLAYCGHDQSGRRESWTKESTRLEQTNEDKCPRHDLGKSMSREI